MYFDVFVLNIKIPVFQECLSLKVKTNFPIILKPSNLNWVIYLAIQIN